MTDYKELIEQLRNDDDNQYGSYTAADVIEKLQAENEQLADNCAMYMRLFVNTIDSKAVVTVERNALQAKLDALQTQEPLIANIFWDEENPERIYRSIEELFNDGICNDYLFEVGAVFTLEQCKRLPSVQIKVTSIDHKSCEAEYEVVPNYKIKIKQ